MFAFLYNFSVIRPIHKIQNYIQKTTLPRCRSFLLCYNYHIQIIVNLMKKKLLWLEDDALLGVVFSKALENTEFELIHVRDGKEAIETLKQTVPHIIMVDLMVPGEIDGFGVLEAINNDLRLKQVPKIVLSNLSNQSDIDRARRFGVENFIVKASSSIDLIIDQLRAQVAGK